MTLPAGAFWPYRLVTGLFGRLLDQYQDRFRIETGTAVTSIAYTKGEDFPYALNTPRGVVKAKKVVHCTNGHSGHLLSPIRGKLYALRGTMSTQPASPPLSNQGAARSWAFRVAPSFNKESGVFGPGLDYMTQNATTGDVFIGGDQDEIENILISDDTKHSLQSADRLVKLLPDYFGGDDAAFEDLSKTSTVWSGIMGFTADMMPLVGHIPSEYTGRPGSNDEYIAAGFNGHGMPVCWQCGTAVAKMMAGEDVSAWFPELFLITPERLEERMSTEIAMEMLTGFKE